MVAPCSDTWVRLQLINDLADASLTGQWLALARLIEAQGPDTDMFKFVCARKIFEERADAVKSEGSGKVADQPAVLPEVTGITAKHAIFYLHKP
ncbi:hypothetical protein HK097_004431 [Rhizophlyctis rosea]|uniref:Uncharacterized protein n=1 Tax=Rhizophlyctis rosea TaxID=64517 RepID=A0AAD5SFH6_9FUNG|nr:hypothetical protein HK097_004431 [Rhizophlyctis rosea]